MKYDARTCVGCGKPLPARQHDVSHFMMKPQAIIDSEHRSWPPGRLSFCAIECLAEGVVRLFNDSLISDWVDLKSSV